MDQVIPAHAPGRSLFLAASLLLLVCGPARAESRERDAWYAYVAAGQRYGSLHVQTTRLPDGNYRIVRHSRLLLDVLGLNKEVVEERGEYVVTPAYRPVSAEVNTSRSSGKARLSGRMRGGAFEVSTSRVGVERSRTIGDATGLVFEPCLADWLADRPTGFREGEVALFDEETGDIRVTRVNRLVEEGPGSAWSLDRGPMAGRQRLVLGGDGNLLERTSEDVGANLRACSAEEARDLSYRNLDGRDMLMFPLGKDVGPPERLAALTVELRWKDIPFERFRLADERQRIIEHSGDGRGGRAVVRIEAPGAVTGSVRYPVGGAEFARFLAESRFIEPRDPAVAETARRVVEGTGDALEAVQALAAWVSKNVEPAMIAETLSGPEVLACRKGKCSEHAILFASLARSVGIPTRIVLGERMIGDRWGGHLWNEAYVGCWVTVDAGYGEVGTSLALLKLVDHETVEGTQELRRKLPASLEIEITDFRKQTSALVGIFRTGVAGLVYTNADFGCRMTAPGEGWVVEVKPQPGVAIVRFRAPGQDDAQLHFVAFPLPARVDPKVVLSARVASYRSRLKGFEVDADEEHLVKGSAGRRVAFRFTAKGGQARRVVEVAWRTASAGFLLALDAEDAAFDELVKGHGALLQSFEDLEKK